MAKDELYTMVGTPVKMYDDQPPNCKVTSATTLTFDRNGNRSTASGNSTVPQHTEAIACGSAPSAPQNEAGAPLNDERRTTNDEVLSVFVVRPSSFVVDKRQF